VNCLKALTRVVVDRYKDSHEVRRETRTNCAYPIAGAVGYFSAAGEKSSPTCSRRSVSCPAGSSALSTVACLLRFWAARCSLLAGTSFQQLLGYRLRERSFYPSQVVTSPPPGASSSGTIEDFALAGSTPRNIPVGRAARVKSRQSYITASARPTKMKIHFALAGMFVL
jgi:hypothetical protein